LPLRVCDTRAGQPDNVCNHGRTTDNLVGPGNSLKINVTGVPAGVTGSPPSIPADGRAEAVALNLEAVAGTAATYLSVFSTDSSGNCPYGNGKPAPPTSNLNVLSGVSQANRVMVRLGPAASGKPATDVCVYNSQGNINLILDVNGWFGSPSAAAGAPYQAIGLS